jgi:ATP-dependent Clp protease protease subunit
MKTWFKIEAKAEAAAEILIYDEIGTFGISAKNFIDELQALGDVKSLTLRINSPGGDVFDGLAIYNVLERHPAEINVTIDGVAASIASVIAMCGDKITMPDNAFMMIHEPWGVVLGTATDMRKLADELDMIKNSIVSAYRKKSGLSDEKIVEMMAAETWMTAQEAVDLRFADEVLEPAQIAARFDLTKFKHPPQISARSLTPAPAARPEPTPGPSELERARAEGATAAAAEISKQFNAILEICAKAGVADMAPELFKKNLSVEDATKRFAGVDTIRSLCVAARLPLRADTYIRAGFGVEEVRGELFKARLAYDEVEIDNHFDGNGAVSSRQKPLNLAEIYARRKAVSKV